MTVLHTPISNATNAETQDGLSTVKLVTPASLYSSITTSGNVKTAIDNNSNATFNSNFTAKTATNAETQAGILNNKLVVLSKEQIAAVSQTLTALTSEAKAEVAENLGIKSSDVAAIAEAMKSNPELATAFVEFESRAESAGEASMPYTLADATTEVQTEAFLADPIGAFTDIDFDKVLNPSEWGKDMTDDQREKAQEVVIPVIIASNIIAAAMTRRI